VAVEKLRHRLFAVQLHGDDVVGVIVDCKHNNNSIIITDAAAIVFFPKAIYQ